MSLRSRILRHPFVTLYSPKYLCASCEMQKI
jgi:hypothetical protein